MQNQGNSKHQKRNTSASISDEGMTNRPSIFAYLVFGPGEVVVGGAARPVRAMIGRSTGAVLGVQARIQGVQFVLVFG
jgi:hypothetical protein